MPTPHCTVWWAAPIAPAGAHALVELLDAHERERLDRFRRDADRARYLAAHALARLVLAPLTDPAGAADPAALVFDRTCRCGQQHGKPVLPGGPGFSLTHAGELVGVAVWPGGQVGLDVEQVRPMTDLAAMIGHAASPSETVADADAFFRLWTRKEALLKATGVGLSAPMTAITADPDAVVWTGEHAPPTPVWVLDLAPAPGYPGAVAGTGPAAPPVRVADGDAVLAAAADVGVTGR